MTFSGNFLKNRKYFNLIFSFYVVHKDYENLLESDILKRLYDYTNKMMDVKMQYADREWVFEDFCKKASAEAVRFLCSLNLQICTFIKFLKTPNQMNNYTIFRSATITWTSG